MMRTAFPVIVLASLLLGFAGLTGFTQSTGPAPDRIEEDWQLVIGDPDPDANGPQVSTAMQPGGDDSSPLVLFNLNYRDVSTYTPGGLQVKVVNDDHIITSTQDQSAVFQTSNETITWTQRMSVSGSEGKLQYK